MIQKTKYIGMLAMLPLVMVALSVDYIGDADAAEIEKKFIMLEDGGTSYTVIFTISTDDKASDAGYERNSIALEAGRLLVTSDKASMELPFGSVTAGSQTSVHLRIVADDPDSITASFVDEPGRYKASFNPLK